MVSVEAGSDVGVDPSTPLLQVVRNCLGVTGTKYACGIAKRAAYTVRDENPCLQRCGSHQVVR
jgi:isoquinoline 1-oxidoreductase alpha subunit